MHPAPFTAWLIIHCTDHTCGEDTHRVDLVLVRGLDLADGPQLWHAMAPPDHEGLELAGTIVTETAGEIPENVFIDWPVRLTPAGPVLRGAAPLARTLS